MKTINVRDLQGHIRKSVETAQKESVVVTRKGRPALVMIGVEGLDWEQVVLQTNPAFWKLIQKRRRQQTLSLAEMKRRLAAKKRP